MANKYPPIHPGEILLNFGLSERFWMNLQTRYDIEIEKDRLQNRLEREVQVYTTMH